MKKTLLLVLTGTLAVAAPATVAAQNGNANEEITTVIVGDKGAVEEVISELDYNAPQRTRESGLPRFAIVGHDRKFYMGIGAQFNGVAAFDWGDNMPSTINFIPSSMTPPAPGNGGKLGFSATTSNFYLNVVALPGTENKIGLFFKGTFEGANYGFQLSHFYVKYRGLTAGYTNSLFQDNGAMPYTIDNQGPNGSAATTVMTGSWTQDFGKGFSGAIGVEAPSSNMADNRPGYTRQVTQRIPAIPLYLQYGWDGGNSHIRLSAIARPLQYRNLVQGKNKTPMGWGVQLSGMVKICDPVTFYYDATYGYGIANYLQDDEGMGLDAMASFRKDGKMKLTESMGLTGGLSFQLSRKWQSSIVYSHLSNWTGSDVRPEAGAYRYGDYVAANILYDLNRFLTFGLEYDYGHAKDFGGNGLHTNRLQGLLQVTF